MRVIVDPGIKLLPDDHRIFVLHPGENKRFYKDFAELNAVFLDFPGIAFETAPRSTDANLWNKLRMARAIVTWHRLDRPEDKKPDRNPAFYKASASGNERPRYFHEVIDLYSEAKKGDLVVVAGPGYRSIVLFDELLSDFDPTFFVESNRYPFEKIPARAVK